MFEASTGVLTHRVRTSLTKRVGQLMALHMFSDWPAQELGFLAKWMHEVSLDAVRGTSLQRDGRWDIGALYTV